MEISGIINNLEDYNQISSDNELDSIIEELSRFSFEDFIYVDDLLNINNIDIMELFEKFINIIYLKMNEDSVEKKVSIFKSLISIFQKGLTEINIVYFFIFLHANSILNIPIGELVKKYDLNEGFNEILIKIFEILNNIKIQLSDVTLSMYFDKEFVLNEEKTIITFLNQVDFQKDNCLLKFNKCYLPNHFYQIIEILYEYKLELFEKLLTSDNIFTLVFIIKVMSLDQINKFLIKYDDIKEKTLLCFLIKFLRITSDDRNNYYDTIVNISIQLYQLNKTLFILLMDIFMSDEFFNEVLGSMFCELSKEDLNILIDSISLNENVHLIDVRTKMLERCRNCENFNSILELIYKKWEKYLSRLFNEKKRSLNILCTDYCNFVVEYYFIKYDDEELITSMKELFIKLKNLDSEWSYNITHHRNKFLVYFSKLFILSVIYGFKTLEDNEIKEFYKDFYDEYVLFKKFLDCKKENILVIFKDNLLTK